MPPPITFDCSTAFATGTGGQSARGTKRRVTMARRRPDRLHVSTSVGKSAPPEEIKVASQTLWKNQTYTIVPNLVKTI